MYNFGFSDLRLVNPKLDWPSEKAHAVSVDAKSIIESAKVYSTLREAISDSTLSIAYTARKRDMSKQFTDNKSIIREIHDERMRSSCISLMIDLLSVNCLLISRFRAV